MTMSDISIYSTTYDAPIRTHRLGHVAVVAVYGDECFSVRFAPTPYRRAVDIGIDGVSLTEAPRGWSPATASDAPRGLILPSGKPGEVKAWAESREGGRELVFTYNVDAGVGVHTGHADSPLRKTIAVNVWKEGAPPVPAVRCKPRDDFERAAHIIDLAITDIEETLDDAWPRFKGEYNLLCERAKTTVAVAAWEDRWAEMVAMASRYRGIRRLIEDEGPAFRAQGGREWWRGGQLGAPVTTGVVGAGEYVTQVLSPTGPLVAPTFEGATLIHWAWWHEFQAVVEAMHALIERNFPATLPNPHPMANLGTTPSLAGSARGQAAHRGYERLIRP